MGGPGGGFAYCEELFSWSVEEDHAELADVGVGFPFSAPEFLEFVSEVC